MSNFPFAFSLVAVGTLVNTTTISSLDLVASNITTLSFAWIASQGPSGFTFLFNIAQSATGPWTALPDTDIIVDPFGLGGSLNVSGLTPSTQYWIEGATVDSGNNIGAFTVYGIFETSAVTLPSKVVGITGVPGTGALALSWTASSGTPPLTYNIFAGTSATGPFTSQATTQNTSYNLPLSGTYWIEIQASSTYGTGPMSDIVGPFVISGAAIPSQVTGVTAAASGPSELTVQWNASTGSNIIYEVYAAASANGPFYINGRSTTLSIVLDGIV